MCVERERERERCAHSKRSACMIERSGCTKEALWLRKKIFSHTGVRVKRKRKRKVDRSIERTKRCCSKEREKEKCMHGEKGALERGQCCSGARLFSCPRKTFFHSCAQQREEAKRGSGRKRRSCEREAWRGHETNPCDS